MLRLILLLALLAAPAHAADLIGRMETANEAIDGAMMQAMGQDPRRAEWTATRRAQSTCALGELTSRRGPAAAERYVLALEAAVPQARKLTRAGEFGGLWARIHSQAGIQLQRDLVPITKACGIGL